MWDSPQSKTADTKCFKHLSDSPKFQPLQNIFSSMRNNYFWSNLLDAKLDVERLNFTNNDEELKSWSLFSGSDSEEYPANSKQGVLSDDSNSLFLNWIQTTVKLPMIVIPSPYSLNHIQKVMKSQMKVLWSPCSLSQIQKAKTQIKVIWSPCSLSQIQKVMKLQIPAIPSYYSLHQVLKAMTSQTMVIPTHYVSSHILMEAVQA